MRKKLLTISLLFLFCGIIFLPRFFTVPFAQIMVPVVPEVPFLFIENENTMLYEQHENTFRPLTTLPQSYFLLFVEEHNSTFYRAIFYDLEGFVRRSAVEKVDFEPVTQFATGTLSITADVIGVHIRARPDHTENNIVGTALANQQFTFYGTLDGTSQFSPAGSPWYFVRFLHENNEFRWGYLYSLFVTAPPIPQNTIEKVMRPYVPTETPRDPIFTLPPTEWPLYLLIIFIACLSVPAILIICLLFKKPKKAAKVPRGF
ncbi:MAG: hypothetical protein FWC82_00085 [Firmicutes bacterium]|nr:hypothetical protein [Bacillota bacterium]